MTPKRSPASPSEPSPTPLFDFAADSPESTPPSAPTQGPKRGRRAKATQETEPTSAPKRSRTAKKSPSRPTKKAAADATPQELPPNERPFAVPKNWLWTRLGDINCYQGKTVTPSKTPDKIFELYSVPSCADDYPEIIAGAEIGSAKQSVQKGDVLLCKINPHINRVWRVAQHTEHELLASSEWIVVRNACIDARFLTRCLQSNYFRRLLTSQVSGVGGSLTRAQPKNVKGYPVPIPPLAEQERIVALVERLFARLDEAAEIVRETLDASEERRSALLRSAFSGALTAQWREKHGVGLETWRQTKFSALCEVVRGGSPRPAGDPTYYDGDIPFLKVADITRNEGPYVYEAQYSIKEAGLKKTRMVEANTLLLTNSGATLGVPAICAFKTTFNDGVAAFLNLPSENLLFYYYFWTSKTAELRAINKGVAQPNLNTDIIGATPINLPSVAEQEEIVRLLDAAFEKERRVCELAEETAARIETLKKAILARAFRGELGTNDPADPKPFAPAPTT